MYKDITEEDGSMMRSLIFLALVAVAQCGSEAPWQCSWGESYWCSSLKVAQQCGAFQHCSSTVWTKQQQPSAVHDGSDVCTFCQSIVGDVRKFLEDQKDQDLIKQYLDSACAIIPDQTMAAECKDMVDNYLDVVLELLATEMDPQTVCSLLGLCKTGAFKDTGLHHIRPAIQKPVVLEPVCTDCKKFFKDIKDLVTSPATEKELEDYIEQNLCSMMGSLQDYCKQMVEAYIPEILDLVTSQLDPSDMCSALGFCNSSVGAAHLLQNMRLQRSPLFLAAQQVPSEEACLLCKTVISELQSLDRDTTVQGEVEDFLKTKLCKQLGSLQDVCISTVDEYMPELFELLANELDPDTICKLVGFCSSSSSKKQVAPPSKLPGKHVAASAQCVLCEFIMKEVDSMLGQNATKQEIIDALNEVCSVLPDTIKQECVQFVKTYAPAIIAILEQEMDPQVVCTFLGLCSSTAQLRKVGDGELCGTCETLIQYLDSLLEENSTIQEVEQLLEKVCNFLPAKLKSECDDIVSTYGPAVIQLIAQFADPREVCTALGLCSQKHVPLSKLLASKPADQTGQQHNLLGSKECTWGPSYWCDNMNNAIKCQAVEHCQKHIWLN